MDSKEMQNAALQEKFGTMEMEAKYTPLAPETAEREYQRLANSLATDVLKPSIREFLTDLIQIIQQADIDPTTGLNALQMTTDAKGEKARSNAKKRARIRSQNLQKFQTAIDEWFSNVAESIDKRMKSFSLADKLQQMASLTRKLTVKEWKRTIQKTIGVDILEDYYDDAFFAEQIEKWIEENVRLIKTIPSDMLDEVKQSVMDSYLAGKTATELTKEINRKYGSTKSHARLIARDQIGKLNADITKYQQTSAGVTKYIWRSSHDERVRDCHRDLDGQTFSWDNPPEMYYYDRFGSKIMTGRHCHPREDFQCRCIAKPIFDFANLDVAVDVKGEDETMKSGKKESAGFTGAF